MLMKANYFKGIIISFQQKSIPNSNTLQDALIFSTFD